MAEDSTLVDSEYGDVAPARSLDRMAGTTMAVNREANAGGGEGRTLSLQFVAKTQAHAQNTGDTGRDDNFITNVPALTPVLTPVLTVRCYTARLPVTVPVTTMLPHWTLAGFPHPMGETG